MEDLEVKQKKNIEVELIANLLIENKHYLTALEFHTELVELGKELPILRDFFSNPSNFELCSTKQSTADSQTTPTLNRSSSQTTLDSLDWARFSEDGERILDDRIAVLEFELRKAKETIHGLRENLTQATANSEVSATVWQEVEGRNERCGDSKIDDLKPHEICTLNFLINEYLVMRNHKMTAITFADENDNQDFENWDDVGLNIPRPPTLIQWLKEKVPDLSPKCSSTCQTDLDSSQLTEEVNKLQDKVAQLENLCQSQAKELEELNQRMSTPQMTPVLSRQRVKKMKVEVRPEDRREAENENEDSFFDPSFDGLMNPQIDECDTVDSIEDSIDKSIDDDQVYSIEDSIEKSSNDMDDNIVESIEDSIEKYPRDSGSKYLIENKFTESSQPTQLDLIKPQNEFIQSNQLNDQSNQLNDQSNQLTKLDCIKETEVENLEIKIDQEYSTTSEVIDPRKCDRLPPLGASTECTPQGFFSGEYIDAQRDEAKRLLRESSNRDIPEFLESQILNVCFGETLAIDSRLQNEVASLSLGQCDLLDLVSTSLHNIAPNIILAKREELLPLLVYCISRNSNYNERERLLHLLFNLTKKPDKERRSSILIGLVCLARILGPDRLEAEILPQCWEQLTHKYQERRLLVAESVAILAPYTPAPIRNSLLLSMLLQLLGPGGEKDPVVREAALASLSLLVSYFEDCEKLLSLINILFFCLEADPGRFSSKENHGKSSNVFLLYSSLCFWSLESGSFFQFFNSQFEKIKFLSKQIDGEKSSATKEQLCDNLFYLFKGLLLACPYLMVYLHNSLPHPSAGDGNSEETMSIVSSQCYLSLIDELGAILGSVNTAEKALNRIHASYEDNPSKEFDLISNQILPQFIESLMYIDISCKSVIREIIHFVTRLCCGLGPRITYGIISPLFNKIFEMDQINFTRAPVVVYTIGILASPHYKLKCDASKPEDLQKFLEQRIISLSLSGTTLSALHYTVTLLLQMYHCQEIVLATLWNCIVYENPCVRQATAPLWQLLVDHVQETELATKIVPALVTLATDSSVEVRAAALSPLAYIVSNCCSKEVSDKVLLQLESLCEESQVLQYPHLQIAIASCCSSMGHNCNPNLLQNIFLPCLCRAALEGKGSPEERLKFCSTLLEAYNALASTPLPDHLVAHFILPPLNQLQKTLGAISYEHMETITVLTKEYTLRAQSTSTGESRVRGSISTPSLSSLSNSLSSSVGGMGSSLPISSGVEDVKNKMSKMFASRSSSFQGKLPQGPGYNISTFFKKK